MYKILLVEDDPNIQEMICDYFSQKSLGKLKIDSAYDGETGVELAYETSYDLLMLDVMLPELDGFEICREVRRESDVPIMFITARAAQEDMLRGYALGCDDYIVKPFPLPVLYEKVRALIKRSKGLIRSPLLRSGTLSLNPNNGVVISSGGELSLTAKEYALLKILLENKGAVVTRNALVKALWGYDTDIDERALDSHIKNLRKSLGENAGLIKTVVKRGYKLEDRQ
jgi:DNA-binding response OmpR family regulator